MRKNYFASRRKLEQPAFTPCDYKGCEGEGGYPAPKSSRNLGEKYWFCLEHIRQYNAAWNYFDDMSTDAFEQYSKDAVTGHRPTWAMGISGQDMRYVDVEAVKEQIRQMFLNGNASKQRHVNQNHSCKHVVLPQEVKEALACLNLSYPVTIEELKQRHRTLVKKTHPDVNHQTQAVEQFKAISTSYHVVKEYLEQIA